MNAFQNAFMPGFMPARLFLRLLFLFLFLTAVVLPCLAIVPRQQPSVGLIASASGDAQIRFVEKKNWAQAAVDQDLLTGDDLRTGPLGSMALLFSDRTQIRVHRNSTLTIKAVASEQKSQGSVFRLNKGGAWARAARDNSKVKIETPSATAAIRGTDWSLEVDDSGRTTLIVLDGTVLLENDYGRVAVNRGEIAVAEIGKAPNKLFLVAPDGRELMYYNMSLSRAMGMIELADLKTRERREKIAGLTADPAQERSLDQWLSLAEMAYDSHNLDMTRKCLAEAGVADKAVLKAREELIRGFLAIADLDFKTAQKLLAEAEQHLDHERRLTAMIGRTAALILNREMETARSLLNVMKEEYDSNPRLQTFRIMLTAFSGDLPQALDMAEKFGNQFPDKAIFPSLEGILSILLARDKAAEKAARRVQKIDPENTFAFFILGTCQRDFLLDHETAIQTFQQGIKFNPCDPDLWGELGLTYYEINEMRLAEKALLKAISLAPKDIVLLCNYVYLLQEQHRMDEAAAYIKMLKVLDPSWEFTLELQGDQKLQTGDMKAAREYFLKATTVNPAIPTAALGLAVAYYQDGEWDLAQQALAGAERLDPNDPDISMVGATIALDQSRTDEAIEYARQAVEKYRRVKGVGISGLAANRGGKSSLGGAFMGISLNKWADYYNEISFDPYSADSHFYRALHAGDDDYSSLYLGLMLEPLAVSSRNRYVDFYYRPFVDFSIGGSAFRQKEGAGYTFSSDIQGFDRHLLPFSYYLNVETTNHPGDVENAETKPLSGLAMAGMNLTPYDRLFVSLSGSDTDTGLPGTQDIPDTDDKMQTKSMSGEIGYAHSFSARNIFMSQFSLLRAEVSYYNADPLGTGLSALDYSLINSFSLFGTQLLYAAGLTDVTDPEDPDNPMLVVDVSSLGQASPIPDTLDTQTMSRARLENDYIGISCRHMFTVKDVDFSYGMEAFSRRSKNELQSLSFSQRDQGWGTVSIGDESLFFPYGDPLPVTETSRQEGINGKGHINALWRIAKTLWVEGGSFVYRYDDDGDTRFTRLGPRAGVAWQIDDRDWLRFVARKDYSVPGLSGLAPAATVGMLHGMNYVEEGGRSTIYQARWGREWFAHLFTALRLSCQDIHDINMAPAVNDIDYGRINSLGLAVNIWIRGGIGLFVDSVFRDTSNRSRGIDGRPDLPLIPKNEVKTGIAWVHPSRMRASLTVNYVRKRPGDIGADDFDDYVTADLALSCQPLDKHLELGVSVTNLFDADYDQATDTPDPGREFSVNAKILF